MDNQSKKMIEANQKYNQILFTIYKYGLLNQSPKKKLIKRTQELGRQIGIKEEELKNIEFSRY